MLRPATHRSPGMWQRQEGVRIRAAFALLFLLALPPTAHADEDCEREYAQAQQAFLDRAAPASALLARAIAHGCRQPELFLYLGVLRREVQDLAGSAALLQQGLALQPDHLNLSLELAVSLAFAGRFAAALQRYEQVLVHTPQLAAAQLGKARVLLWMGRAAESRALYRALLAQAPTDREIRRGLAAAYTAQLRLAAAKDLYRRLLHEDGSDAEARAGLAQLQQITRWEFVALLGATETVGSGLSPTGGLRASYVLTPAVTLLASYQLDAPLLYGDLTQQPGLRQRAEAGLLLHLTPRIDFSLGYQLAAWPNTLRHALPLGGSLKLGRSWIALAGLRPGLDQHGVLSQLSFLGLQATLRPELWAMLQLFRYDDTGGQYATALVGTLHLPLLHHFTLRLGGVLGAYSQGDLYAGFAELWWRCSQRLSLGATYQGSAGFLEQHSAALGLRVGV